MPRTLRILFALLSGCLLSSPILAQQAPPPKAPAAPAPAGKTVKITEQVAPAFSIDPIVNRIEARRGKVLTVEWKITSEGDPVQLEIRPVALTQDENGGIFPNSKVPPPEELQLISPPTVSVGKQESFTITAKLRVPDDNSTFHTFGVLVRDAGQLKDKPNEAPQEGPRVRIKFITQYLLRADITVQGVRAESAAKLLVESAELVEVNGIPVARAYITNPTKGPIEFGARMQIRNSEESDERPTFPLGMPVRANMELPDRYVARILAGARIKVESPLPKPIFPGQYYIETSLLNDNRVLLKSGFPVAVQDGQYPAQGIATVVAGPGILASPSQLELSLQRGGSRVESLTLTNDGDQPTVIDVIPETLEGQALEWAVVRPNQVTLPPGTSRKVSITLSAGTDTNSTKYGRLRIKTTREGAEPTELAPVLIAGLGRTVTQPALEGGELVWDTEHGIPAFVTTIKNTGERHAAIEGMLTLGNEAGTTFELRGGFGKWVLPGETISLRFNPPKDLQAGHYSGRLVIPRGETADPIDQKIEIDLAP